MKRPPPESTSHISSATPPKSFESSTGFLSSGGLSRSVVSESIKRQKVSTASESSIGPSHDQVNGDLFSFFRRLPHDTTFEKLFQEPGVVLALFRSLSDSERVTVLRILELPEAVRWEPFIIWHKGDRRATLQTLNSLRGLHLLTIRQQHTPVRSPADPAGRSSPASSLAGLTADNRSGVAIDPNTGDAGSVTGSNVSRVRLGVADVRYQLQSTFKKTLKQSLTKGYYGMFNQRGKPPKHFPTKGALHSHASRQWKNVLQWLVNGKQNQSLSNSHIPGLTSLSSRLLHLSDNPQPSIPTCPDLILILQRLRLLEPFKNSETRGPIKPSAELTNETFQWLLKDCRDQLLSICLDYIKALHYGIFISTELQSSSSSSGTTYQHMNTTINDHHIIHSNTQSNVSHTSSVLSSSYMSPVSTDLFSKQMLEVLGLLFTLSELLIGQPCSMNVLTQSQRRFIQLAYHIGLVWAHKPIGAKHFFPTPLARLLQANNSEMPYIIATISHLTSLHLPNIDNHPYLSALTIPSELYYSAYSQFFTSDTSANYPPIVEHSTKSSASQESIIGDSGVIVESNFKVFAYTSYPLLIIIIARLCEIRVITPSLIVGVLSRESILEAYKSGVTSDQIIRFFTTHVHPSIYSKSQREGKPLLPENVAAQLRIWEDERRRIRMHKACIFEFSKESDLEVFPLAVSRAQMHWLLMNTEIPSSSNSSSKQFQDWKTMTLEKMKTRPAVTDSIRPPAPVLAIHAKYKDDMTYFIRSIIRNPVKR